MNESKILILYKSKYGATEKYVNILKSKFNCDVFNLNINQPSDYEEYDIVVLAGGIYASGISIMSFLRRFYDNIRDKKVAIFCVGASPFNEKAFEEIKERNLKEDLKDIPVFYGRGAWDERKMNFIDGVMCKVLNIVIKRKDPNTYEPWMKAFVESNGKQCNWVDEKYLEPLIDWILEEE